MIRSKAAASGRTPHKPRVVNALTLARVFLPTNRPSPGSFSSPGWRERLARVTQRFHVASLLADRGALSPQDRHYALQRRAHALPPDRCHQLINFSCKTLRSQDRAREAQ